MTVQMTLRIPDDLAAFVDQQVTDGGVANRTAVVAAALHNEMRRLANERDAEIYATTPADADLDAFVGYTAAHPVEFD